MATEVVEIKEVTLQDEETKVKLRPLVISRLRRFMDRWEEFSAWAQEQSKIEKDDERITDREFNLKQFEVYMDLAVICLDKELQGEKSEEEFRDFLEEVLDEPTLFEIFDRKGGLKLGANNPNLQALLQSQGLAGTN